MIRNTELLDCIKNYDEVVIFGAANIGLYLYQHIKANGNNRIVVLCDNSHRKQIDIEVLPVEQAAQFYKKAVFLLTSPIHENTMRNQLLLLDIPAQQIVYAVTDEALQYDIMQKSNVKLKPLKELQFEVDIASHCNLNCKCCSQFSCIAEEEFIDVRDMEKDFKRLGELFEGKAKRIYLIGGEPLLHPNIVKCMEIARTYFPTGKISVFTNGILLMRCDEGFWESCIRNHISIIITKYPIKLDYESMIKKANAGGVEFEFFGNSEDYKYMTNLGLDPEGKQEVKDSFIRCTESNNCIKLRKGKLYTCTRPAAIYKFNQFFGLNLKVEEEDSIDIYKASSSTEILEKLAHPIPFCRYCNMSGIRKAMEWGPTERKIEEWL